MFFPLNLDEFCPNSERSTDDEETIAQEEATNKEEESDEVAALQRESEMDFESFLNELPKDYLQNRDKIKLSDDEQSMDNEAQKGSKSDKKPEQDDDFVADTSSEEDDEDTIQEQEEAEGSQDHKQELDDLEAENEMSIDELRRKYAALSSMCEDTVMSSSSSVEEQKQTEGEDDGNEEKDGEASNDGSSSDEELSKDSEIDEDVNDMDEDEEQEDENGEEEVGLKLLLNDEDIAAIESQNEGEEKKTDNNDLINDAAAIAESIQPKGNTLSSTSVSKSVIMLNNI